MESHSTQSVLTRESIEHDPKVFGFWVYLMTDLIIFSVLFAVFIVNRNSTFGGPTGKDLYDMSSVLYETLFLLASSFTCSLGMLSVYWKQKNWALMWFLITFVFGAGFLYLELKEFANFVADGASWQRSAFLSSFFTLVGTHGVHITAGLIWMAVAMFGIIIRPFSEHNVSKIFRMALFWHFLDFVWIFIFTVVYGMGYLL
jgi:cytochrome o ubiquinol oxidase subunit 3